MKKRTFVALALATFLGAFGALKLDKYLTARPDLLASVKLADGFNARNADYTVPVAGPIDFRAPAKKVLPSVVSVDRYEEIQNFMMDTPKVQETGTGSGVVISQDGVIVTNNHVVASADGTPVTQVRVRLADKRVFTAKVLGTDPRSDLAVIKIDAQNLTPIEIANSDKIEVGEWVLAVGNPLGYDQTVSVGVVSNKARSLPSENGGVLLNAIQTDAAINPGNSGGALTNAHGQLIGINSAIITNTGTTIGIGFAIPSNRVMAVAKAIVEDGRVHYGVLGIEANPRLDGFLGSDQGRQELSQAVNESNVPEKGLIIPPFNGQYGLVPGQAAALAGIKPLDVLLSINDTEINGRVSLFEALSDKKAGEKVSLKYWTHGKVKTIMLTLGEEAART